MTNLTLKGNPIHTSGPLPILNSQAKDFRLVNQKLADVSLKDFQGKKKLLYTVPSLDTPVCSISTKKLSEGIEKHSNACFLLISADLPFAQTRFCGAEKIENIHTLSMMRSKQFAEDYGVLITDGPLAGLCARAVFILDEQNKIIYLQVVAEITEEPDYEAALRQLV